jgi:hypothetical protein
MDSKAIWKASDKRSKVERQAEILLPFFCLFCKAGAASGSDLILQRLVWNIRTVTNNFSITNFDNTRAFLQLAYRG